MPYGVVDSKPALDGQIITESDMHILSWLLDLWLLTIDRRDIGNARTGGLGSDFKLGQ